MEAGRAVAGGFVTPDRTTTIASTSRSYLVVEKMAMADGRYDQQRLIEAVQKNSRNSLLLDMEAIARESGAMINAVMLGVVAGTGALPIPAEAFEAAIRADGKAVEANLRGFRAGLAAAQNGAQTGCGSPASVQRPAVASLAELEQRGRAAAGKPRAHSRAKACGGSPPIRTSPMRGFISIGLRRSAMPTRRPKPAAASSPRRRGISRCACRMRT